MTDQNREELIEEAAATIAVAELVSSHRTWGDLLEPQKDEYRRLATQVLTVFEQAHTPTSDERARLVSAEPQAEPPCVCPNTLGWHTAECVAARPEPETPEAHAYSKGFTDGGDQARRDAQAEPTDAQVRAALNVYASTPQQHGKGRQDAMRAALRAAFKAGEG